MKKLIALILVLVVAAAGVYAVTHFLHKAPEREITGIAFLQKDQNGNDLVLGEITQTGEGAHLSVTGPLLMGTSAEADLDSKSFGKIQESLKKIDFSTWTALTDGQTIEAPNGGYAVIIGFSDGTVYGATSDTLSPQAMEQVVKQLTGVLSNYVKDLLGVDLGFLGNFL